MKKSILSIAFIFLFFHTSIGQADKCVLIIADKMNVLYAWVENPVTVIIAGFSNQSVKVKVEGCEASIRSLGKGRYEILPKDIGELKLFAMAGDLAATMTFRVKSIPDPIPALGMSGKQSNITSAEMKTKAGLIMWLDNFDFDARCLTISYTITRIAADGHRESVPNEGARFGEEGQKLIQKAQPGDYYIFENIKSQCQEEESLREISNLAVLIDP